ncbi:dipeptide ABC transporter ATP-binding protein [Microbacterium sp. A8/3-1]|uniref:Dipeptide ABC transporter ATP-binding protein n=1 Tax=Microbacterium sp. A8/3-1 TaxID=3160749 RepID=A0AAU7W2D9_9MICO
MTDTELLLAEETAQTPRRTHFLRAMLRRPSASVSLLFLLLVVISCVFAGVISPYSPFQQNLDAVYQGPSAVHPLGTDSLGRDLLSRLLHGGQVTLSGAIVAVLVYGTLGVLIGILAGTARGRIDAVIMRFVDLMLSIPGLIVLLVVLAIFGSNEMAAMITLGVLSAPSLIRVVRGSTLAAKTELFVTAARVAGLTPAQVQRRHILPAISGPAITQITLFAAAAILTEAGLGYLGLGVQPPQPNWGNLINDAQQAMMTSPWMLVPTGGVLVLVSLALGMLGNAIRDSYMGRGARSDDGEQSWKSMAADVRRSSDASQAVPAADTALLSVRGLSVTLGDGAKTIVSSVDLDVAPGESVGIVGESGSGKTMFVTALLRMTPPGSTITAQTCRFDGRELSDLDERAMNAIRGKQIAYITQESISSLDPVFTAGEQVAEAVRQHRGVSRREARRITRELFAMVRLPDPDAVAARYPHELSGGMAQRVCIARALAGEPRLLIADEPTTALDVTVQAEILDLLRDLREQTGMALLIVTHDWGVLADSCDRALVMYHGEVVEQAPVIELVRTPQHAYSAALLAANPSEVAAGCRLPTVADTYPEAGAAPMARTEPRPEGAAETVRIDLSGEPLLRIEDLSVTYPGRGRRKAHPALEGVSIDVGRGETVGVVGESGSGKSTTGNSVLGLTPISGGRIVFDGEDITGLPSTGRRDLSRRLQAIFQDPYSSLNPHRTVGQSITETLEADRDDDRGTRRDRAIEMLASVGLDAEAYDRYPGQFSGGQRQRISIARAMLPSPELIVCDEVVSALDLSVQAQVINLLVDLQRENGLSYLFITHDLSVVKHLCQRVIVLRNGQIVEEGPTQQVLNDPQTAYTKRLVLAAPVIDPDRQRERRLERLTAMTTNMPSLKGA